MTKNRQQARRDAKHEKPIQKGKRAKKAEVRAWYEQKAALRKAAREKGF